VIVQPHRLIYRIAGDQVFLLLVADGRRDFQGLLERRILRD
jgi:toxin ParE1/3/4